MFYYLGTRQVVKKLCG